MTGVSTPNSANIAVGSIPRSPMAPAPNPRSSPIRGNSGDTEVTAARSVNADRMSAANTNSRPCSVERDPGSAVVAVAVMGRIIG